MTPSLNDLATARARLDALLSAGARMTPRDRKAVRLLLPEAKAPRKSLPGQSIAGKRAEKKEAQREETRAIREAVMARAAGHCERCGGACEPSRMHWHHLLGGVGRRRQQQSVETTCALCPVCHDITHAHPRAAAQLRAYLLPRLAQHPNPTAAPSGEEHDR